MAKHLKIGSASLTLCLFLTGCTVPLGHSPPSPPLPVRSSLHTVPLPPPPRPSWEQRPPGDFETIVTRFVVYTMIPPYMAWGFANRHLHNLVAPRKQYKRSPVHHQ